MCGLVGFVSSTAIEAEELAVIGRMADAIRHRGPDDGGEWCDAEGGIALGHRRLSIIDLTAAGHQPMVSHDGRFVIAYNGEIYNFNDLRTQLENAGQAPDWHGRSDTETFLAFIAARGVRAAVERAEGMFAFALWDRSARRLTLGRDRMGEKPLHYGWQGSGKARRLLFGSELSAIRCHPSFESQISKDAVTLLLRHMYIPDPLSIYDGIYKLLPGTIKSFDFAHGTSHEETYWDHAALARQAASQPFGGSAEEAALELEKLLGSAVNRQTFSDVPIGAFLSGGIDSSVIAALIQSGSSRPITTFTIGFDDAAYDESGDASIIARTLGTDHNTFIVRPDQLLDVVPKLPSMFSEPFADSSQIPTYLVSSIARQQVTVALSGDAGDELFGGYNRYAYSRKYWPLIARLPVRLRKIVAHAMQGVPPTFWDEKLHWLLGGSIRNASHKVARAASILSSENLDELYLGLLSMNSDAAALTHHDSAISGFEGRNTEILRDLPAVDRMMILDTLHYLPGDILTKVDRAAMATSLETRVPMLDPNVVKFAWSLPNEIKFHAGKTKWPLRRILERHVPADLFNRPKMGFGVPIASWLRTSLKPWADQLLERRKVDETGLLQGHVIQDLWEQHLSGNADHAHKLWPVLMLMAWFEIEKQY